MNRLPLVIKTSLKKTIKIIFVLFNVLLEDLKRLSLFKEASAMAYVTLISLVPSLAVLFSLVSMSSTFLVGKQFVYDKLKEIILSVLSSSTGEEVLFFLNKFIFDLNMTKLTISASCVLLIVFVFLLRHIETTLNRIWVVDKERNFFKRFIYFWTFVTLGSFLVSLLYGYLVNLKTFSDYQGVLAYLSSETMQFTIKNSLIFVSFFFVFKIVPNCFVRWDSAVVGAFFSSILFFLITRGFRLYIEEYSNFRYIYSALASVPIFLIWLYLCWIVILMGALASWRWQYKIYIDSEYLHLPYEKDQLIQDRFKTVLPMIVLILIQKKFLDSSFDKFNLLQLYRSLKVPISWIKSSLDTLEKAGYLVLKRENDSENSEFFLGLTFFPTKSADQITRNDLKKTITQPIDVWIDKWRHNLPNDVILILKSLLTTSDEARDHKDKTLKELIRRDH